MARSASTDRRFLELHRGKWRVSVPVPRHLHAKLGTRLKEPLHTDSLAVANTMKWQVVAKLKARLEGNVEGTKGDSLRREAIELATLRDQTDDAEDRALLDMGIDLRMDDILGQPIGAEIDDGREREVYDPERKRRAAEFYAIAKGAAVPLDAHHEAYLGSIHVKPRTRADDIRAMKFLERWCEANNLPKTLQSITRKRAVKFLDDLPGLGKGISTTTLQKYVNRLSRHWQWLQTREHVEANVWSGLKYEIKPTAHDEKERAFTEDEMKKLLTGDTSQAMHDLMRIGALTGARLDAIVDLTVGDCQGGLFDFKPQKKETKVRSVPIHSALVEIVARRSAGKEPKDDLFPEWPAPKKEGSLRERSFKASNAFTAYRRSVGVEEKVDGKRRSLVNYHSFRRWFITMAERADQPESIIAVVVGHARKGMTLGRYSAGPLIEQARRCVEAVKLPE